MKIEDLKSLITGTVTTPQDAVHADAAAALQWNARKQLRRPIAIVTPASVADVQTAVRFAAEHGIPVSPRGGGHNLSGIAMQEAIVIDLVRFDSVQIDAARRLADVGPAVTNGALATALEAEDLAFPLGHCSSVPMSGYLLGGGLGWNSGSWGFACSRIESLEVVTADGTLRHVSASEWPDIYWAARGAGPEFFGVVVGYRLRLEPLPKAIMSAVRVYPLERVAELERWMSDVLYAFPSEVDFAIDMRNVPVPDQERTMAVAAGICVVYGRDEAEVRDRHMAIAGLAPDHAMTEVGPMLASFGELYAQADQSMPLGHRYLIDSFWADAGAKDMVARIAEAIAVAPSALCHSIVTRYSDARPVMPDAAFSRSAPVWGSVCAIWDNAQADAANIGWVREVADAIGTAAVGHYVGECDLERPGRLARCYAPAALDRLQALQKLHDPKGLLRRSVAAPATTKAA